MMPSISIKSDTRSAAAGALAALTAVSLGTAALAGPSWDSDLEEDAGATADSAQEVFANSMIQQISGTMGSGGLLGGIDTVDMYLVRVTQPTMLSLSTAGGELGGFSSFNSSLFLYRAVQAQDGSYVAQALLANDDAEDGTSGSFIGSSATDGSGFTIADSGLYFIMITMSGLTPQSASGAALWQGLDATGTIAFGGGQAFGAVGGDATDGGGAYQIRLTGVSGIPAPGAIALLSLAGFRTGRGRRR